MSEVSTRVVSWLPMIPLLPFIGFVINGTIGKRLGKKAIGAVAVAMPLASFVLALAAAVGLGLCDSYTAASGAGVRRALYAAGVPAVESPTTRVVVIPGRSVEEVKKALDTHGAVGAEVKTAGELAPHSFTAEPATWIAFAGFRTSFRFVLDRLAAVMVLVVLGVGSLIHIYSTGYMHGESTGGYARYFAYLNFFTSMMLVLVTAGDLPLLFVGWEGVGLASYLLIGFEYQEGWKAEAGIKAFVVNRVGDLGFILGTVALAAFAAEVANDRGALERLPQATTAAIRAGEWLRIDVLREMATVAPAALLGVACLLLFLGATGKSAQIPLFVWLPDAMAGPTPVSALIHAATMVTAGIYMLARLSPLFEAAYVGHVPVLAIVAAIGIATAFLAGTAALAQDDVKKVLAYSTVSQLGYMFVGLGAGVPANSIFHLVTHAFFKALLFLGAGALIHATGTQDLRKMGGLKKKLPVIFWTMAIGAVALAGAPPFSGFFSKDAILVSVIERAERAHAFPWAWWTVYGVGLVTAAMTAFYSGRLVILAFLGDEGEVAKTKHDLHDAPGVMAGPLIVLAALATVGGLLGLPEIGHLPGGQALQGWLAPILGEPARGEHGLPESMELAALGGSAGIAIVMLLVARAVYLPKPRGIGLALETARFRPFLQNAWYVDATYLAFIARPIVAIARRAWAFVDDLLLDRVFVDGAGRLAEALSLFARAWQTGRVPRYAAYFAVGVVAVLVAAVVMGVPA